MRELLLCGSLRTFLECYYEGINLLFFFMEETDIVARLKIIDEKLSQVQESVVKTKKYLWWGLILQLGMMLVPLLLIMLAIPFMLSTFQGMVGSGLL